MLVKNLIGILLGLLAAGLARGQDLHFSQPILVGYHFSPAETGVFIGEMRLAGVYKRQWRTIPASFATYGASFDKKMGVSHGRALALGLSLFTDKAGDGGLQWNMVTGSASYSVRINAGQQLTVGVGMAVAQRIVQLSSLTFKNQFDGELFDPLRASGEPSDGSGLIPLVSAGAAWWGRTSGESRTNWMISVGGHHLNAPNAAFKQQQSFPLPRRWSAAASAAWQLGQYMDWVALAAFQMQGKNRENLLGTGVKYHIPTASDNEQSVQLGVGYRLRDAIIPSVQLEWEALTLGVSYDISVSKVAALNRQRGGFEIAVVKRWVKPLPPPNRVLCPVF